MVTSDNGIKFIERMEGTILHAYHDSAGYLTIGTGHLVRPEDGYTVTSTITQAQCDQLLRRDLHTAEWAIQSYVHAQLTQNQFDALASLAFNIGDHAFGHSTLVSLINAKQADGVIRPHWLEWNKAGGKLNPGLLRRRQLEFNLYTS